MRYIESVATHPKLQAFVAEIESNEVWGPSEFDAWMAVVSWYENSSTISDRSIEAIELLGDSFEKFTTWKGGKVFRGLTIDHTYSEGSFLNFLSGKHPLFPNTTKEYDSWSRSHKVSEGFSLNDGYAGIVASRRISSKDILIDFTDPLVRAWISRMKQISSQSYQGRYKGADKEIVAYGSDVYLGDVAKMELDLSEFQYLDVLHEVANNIMLFTPRGSNESIREVFREMEENDGMSMHLILYMKNGKLTNYRVLK